MVIGQGSERIEISVREVMRADSPAAGDRRIMASVTCREFSARDREAWVSAADWAQFDRELHALDQSRQGEARLVSQSPASLRLRLHAWDRAGHIAVEGHVGGYHSVAGRMHEIRLTFAFDLDSGMLGEVVRAFDALAPAV